MFKHILIVCVGNVCRSPMAEALLTQALLQRPNNSTTVSSAGLGALVGKPPVIHAFDLMLEKGIDVSHYQGKQLDSHAVRRADLIWVMEKHHKNSIELQYPSAKGKVFLLGHWGDFEIQDPYQQERTVFLNTLEQIETGIKQWLLKI